MSELKELELDKTEEADLDLDLPEFKETRRPRAPKTKGAVGNKKSKMPLYAGGTFLIGAALYLGSSMVSIGSGLRDSDSIAKNVKAEPTFSEVISSAVEEIRDTLSDQDDSLGNLADKFAAYEREFNIYKGRIISHDERLDSQDALISQLGLRISDAEKKLTGIRKKSKAVKKSVSVRKVKPPVFPYQIESINSLGSTEIVSLFVNGEYSIVELNEKFGGWKLVGVFVKESKATFRNIKTSHEITIKV